MSEDIPLPHPADRVTDAIKAIAGKAGPRSFGTIDYQALAAQYGSPAGMAQATATARRSRPKIGRKLVQPTTSIVHFEGKG